MNKLGFTLVELLAVIVILGIIGAIGTVSYTQVVSNTKNKVYKTYESTMKDGVTMYIIDNGVPNNKIMLNTLVNGHYIDKFNSPLANDFCDNSYVEVTKNGSNIDLTYKVCLICNNYRSNGC